MFGIAAVIAFAIATLMDLFGWGSGKVTVTLFALLGLLFLALHVAGVWTNWRRPAS